MKSPEEIKSIALKKWKKYHIQKAYLEKQQWEPFQISQPKLTEKDILKDLAKVQANIKTLRVSSKEHLGYGYEIIFRISEKKSFRNQEIPTHIVFNSLTDFLKFIGKEKEYKRFEGTASLILNRFPKLKELLIGKPKLVLKYEKEWSQILEVATYLHQRPLPNVFVRELDVSGVDTKFIETHQSIFKKIFPIALPENGIRQGESPSIKHEFEFRYGFKVDPPLIRFRILDSVVSPIPKITDMSFPLNEFASLDFPCETVFVTENKINGLSFPSYPNSIIIFGLGYGILSIKSVEWLKPKKLFYWGDIDTHGFSILSKLREHFPSLKSFLMDEETLEQHWNLKGQEEESKRCRENA